MTEGLVLRMSDSGLYLPKLHLWDVCVAANSKHDRQGTITGPRLSEAVTDEIHVCVCFLCKAHAKENVDCKTRISDPRKAIVPVPVLGQYIISRTWLE
jgi:hypothetical protein